MPIDLSLDDSEDKCQPTNTNVAVDDEDDCEGGIPMKRRRTDVDEPASRNFTPTESYGAAEDEDSVNKVDIY